MNDKIKRIIEDDSRWKPHQVDHLLLLIGGNPLPNAVAAVLLTSPNGTITLIHSKKESPNTFIEHQDVDSFPVAQKLESWLNGFGYKEVRLTGVHESRPDSIIQGVLEALKTIDAVKVGINYTGGTKAMSVHAYRAVEQWVAEQSKEGKKIEASFSYLDARQMKMVFDRTTSMPSEALYAGRVMKLELEKDLLQIHGWKLKHQPIQTPILPQSAQALLDVYTKPKDTCCWQEWLEKELFKKAKRSEQMLVTCLRSSDDQPCNFDHPGEKWKSKSNLKNTTLSWPTVQELKTLVET
ncbi:MAG: hypothetical protein JNN15_17975, partial [Blastocatellia bacterium]|nr:hypothetical protein [Blastocatellia bacterium]